MGSIFDNCPSVQYCCGSVPLRPAVFAIAILGILAACFGILGFTPHGPKVGEKWDPSSNLGQISTKYVDGVFAVLLLAISLLLLVAAIFESRMLCEVYLWVVLVDCVVEVGVAVVVTIAEIIAANYLNAGIYFLWSCFNILMLIYFMIVVNSYRKTLP